jgi:hypothetical protein
VPKGDMLKNVDTSRLKLQKSDIELICKALELYDLHSTILNSEIFPISEDDLSNINNDAQYLKGLIAHLKASLSD